jgi:heme A synthase
MYRKRIGIWIIFVAICMVSQLIIPTIPHAIISVKQWSLDQKIEAVIKENEVIKTEPVVDVTNTPDATETPTDGEANQEQLSDMTTTMIKIITSVARYVGILVVVYGIFMVVLGFRDDNAEAISRAISALVVGAVLLGFSALAPNLFGFSP